MLASPNINKFDLYFQWLLIKYSPDTVVDIWEPFLVVIQSGTVEPHRVFLPTICNSKDVVTGDTRLEGSLLELLRFIV